jgi:cytochrome c biogenesis protein CcmG, thiol:disulfide interchange protein DsbE
MKFLVFPILLLIGISNCSFAQESKARKIPAAEVKTLDGKTFNTESISNDGKPIIISFWATWCSPCKKELNAIAELYEDWQEQTGVKVIAISIDDARNLNKVGPYVNGRGWDFEVYLDPNQDFKRAMNVNNVPHSFLINSNQEIVWQHNSYAEGDELKLFQLVKKLAAGETVGE